MMRRGRGLTLLELAMVLAVLAVLSALALPSMGARLDRQRAQSAAEGLAADLTEARFEAARRGQPLFVQAEGQGADWCWAVATEAGCACGGAASACQLRQVRAAEHRGVKLVQGLSVRLDPAGTAQQPHVALLETKRGERLRVELSALGRPRVCAVSGTWPRIATC